ncbi:MAG: branched-chain amino acid ABC transporter permease [Rubrivivax sp.]|nr:branched-chain amino acid ABC transporter permease [Rubrivivax sp.]
MLSYLLFFVTVAAILSFATLGLNLQWGLSGQFNAGVVGFVAIGGYTLAVLSMPATERLLVQWNLPYAVALAASLLTSAAAAALVGLATLRLRSDYLAIATFGVGSAIQLLANNLESLTGGSRGLVGIPRPFEALGAQGFAWAYAAIVLGLLTLSYAALQALLHSPWGRVQRALREDEAACAALGKDVVRLRLSSFVLGSMLMGLSGALYAGFVGTTSPSEFLPILTFQIWAMLIVGGSGSNRGAIAGTFVVWGLWTLSGAVIGLVLPARWQAQAGALQSTLVGLVLVLTLLLRPQGLLGARRAA